MIRINQLIKTELEWFIFGAGLNKYENTPKRVDTILSNQWMNFNFYSRQKEREKIFFRVLIKLILNVVNILSQLKLPKFVLINDYR